MEGRVVCCYAVSLNQTTESREWNRGRIRGPAAPMHLDLTNEPFVHRFQFPPSSPEALHVQRRERPLISEGGKYGREMADPILPTACDFHGKCKDLLHVSNLRHGTDSFTSPPKEGMLRIFSSEKSDGFSRVSGHGAKKQKQGQQRHTEWNVVPDARHETLY